MVQGMFHTFQRLYQINSWGFAKLVRQRILIPPCTGSSPVSPTNGVRSVVACTLLCESGSTGSIPVGYPNAALADVVIAAV